MARLSDIIEDFIKQMFNENRDNVIFIQRNELADQFRGGGGHIAIKQLEVNNSNKREELISQSIGDTITYHNANSLLNHLLESGLIEERECEIMKIAINDRSLTATDNKNKVRADILKAMIMIILS